MSLACASFVEKTNAADKIWLIFTGAAAPTIILGAELIRLKFIQWRELGEIKEQLGVVEGKIDNLSNATTDVKRELGDVHKEVTTLTGIAKKTQGRVETLNVNLWKFNQKTTLTLAGLKTDTNTLNKKTNVLNGLLVDVDTKVNTLTEETLPNFMHQVASAKDLVLNQITKMRDEQVTRDYLKQEFDTFKKELTLEVANTVRTTMQEEFSKQNKGFERVIHQTLHAAITAGFLNPTRSLLPSSTSHNSNDSNNLEDLSQSLSPSSSVSNLSTSESE